MSQSRRQVLQMLQDGKVSADQAMDLLQALETAEALGSEQPEDTEALTGEIIQPTAPPDMERFRRFWQIPFLIAFAALIVIGLGLRSLYQTSDGAITLWFVCVWSLFILAFVAVTLAFLSRRATWVHVRVQEKQGRRIAISLPLPLGIARWGIDFARGFVGERERETLDMAADFLETASRNLTKPGADPLMINVDDDDGDRVQVYIG